MAASELGKVDQGGGGNGRMYIAGKNIDRSWGVAVLPMHAPNKRYPSRTYI